MPKRSSPRGPTVPGNQLPVVRFLVHGAERSGPPIYALRLIREWARTSFPLHVEVVIARPGPLAAEFRRVAPTTTARLDRASPERLVQRGLSAAHLHPVGRNLMAAATRHRASGPRPDLTVVNAATAATVELLETLDDGVGSVVTIAHELSTGWFSNLTPRARSMLLSRSAAYLAVSESVRNFLVSDLGVHPDVIRVIPPPVDHSELVSTRTRHAASVPLVGGMGVTDWRKAPELWLRVASLVIARLGSGHVRFRWVGGDTLSSRLAWHLEHEIRQLDLGEAVEFMGSVESPWSLLADASVIVSTAREDAYPLAIAEAIASGIPVVGFDIDGVGEIVRSSGCGVVVPYADEHAVSETVIELIGSPDVRASMSERGIRFAREELAVQRVAPRVGDWLIGQAS